MIFFITRQLQNRICMTTNNFIVKNVNLDIIKLQESIENHLNDTERCNETFNILNNKLDSSKLDSIQIKSELFFSNVFNNISNSSLESWEKEHLGISKENNTCNMLSSFQLNATQEKI